MVLRCDDGGEGKARYGGRGSRDSMRLEARRGVA